MGASQPVAVAQDVIAADLVVDRVHGAPLHFLGLKSAPLGQQTPCGPSIALKTSMLGGGLIDPARNRDDDSAPIAAQVRHYINADRKRSSGRNLLTSPFYYMVTSLIGPVSLLVCSPIRENPLMKANSVGQLTRSPIHMLHRASQPVEDVFASEVEIESLAPRQLAVLMTV